MTTHRVNPSGAPITSCDEEMGCQAVSCEVCLVEIPPDLAYSHEGPDYVHHFCGLNCLDLWKAKAEKEKK